MLPASAAERVALFLVVVCLRYLAPRHECAPRERCRIFYVVFLSKVTNHVSHSINYVFVINCYDLESVWGQLQASRRLEARTESARAAGSGPCRPWRGTADVPRPLTEGVREDEQGSRGWKHLPPLSLEPLWGGLSRAVKRLF